MSDRALFYQRHLDRVSRSFAFCIAELPDPLREWVGLSYLLCRVLDTIEDAPWADPAAMTNAFARFDAALAGDAADWIPPAWPASVSADERALAADGARLLADFHRLPPDVREILREPIASMSRGMQHFARTRPLRLCTPAEVNQYCFFVAGVVGELLAGLLARIEPGFNAEPAALIRAHHFGRFLQKVNVLKDQPADEASGRFLIPDRAAVEASAAIDAAAALEFVALIPRTQPEFRRFCGWSLFLGLEALGVAREAAGAGRVLKVARPRTLEILNNVAAVLSRGDGDVATLFGTFTGRLGWGPPPPDAARGAPVPDWFLDCYRGGLAHDHLLSLGLGSGPAQVN